MSWTEYCILLMAVLAPVIRATCPTIFYAKNVNISDISISFYETRDFVQTATECANICASKQFCRTAVFNQKAYKCALSYESNVECGARTERYNTYFLEPNYPSPLTLIACIDRCRKGEKFKSLEEQFSIEARAMDIQKRAEPKSEDKTIPNLTVHMTTPSNNTDSVTPAATNKPKLSVITEVDKIDKKVQMNAKPLSIEEVNSNEHEQVSSNSESTVVRTIQNGTVIQTDSGSIVAVKPTGSQKVELITLSPAEFDKLVNSDSSGKTSTATFNGPQEKHQNLTELLETVKQQIIKHEKIQQQQQELLTAATVAVPSTTTEPTVINGHVLSPAEAQKLFDYEKTTTTTTTTPAPIVLTTEPEFYENTFVMTGVDKMFKEALARQRHHSFHGQPQLSTDAVVASPAICYKTIPQQQLIRAGFRKLDGRVSLKECRCACASTWMDKDPSKVKCMSLQYDEAKMQCTLNRGDHNGKYDLVFNKRVDYQFISCELGSLLDLAENICVDVETTPDSVKVDEIDGNSVDGGETATTSKSIESTSASESGEEVDGSKKDKSSLVPVTMTSSTESTSTLTEVPKMKKKLYEGDSSEVITDSNSMPETRVVQTLDKLTTNGATGMTRKGNVTEKIDVFTSTTTTTTTTAVPSTSSSTTPSTTPSTSPSTPSTTTEEETTTVTTTEAPTTTSTPSSTTTTTTTTTTTVPETAPPSTSTSTTTTTTTTRPPTTAEKQVVLITTDIIEPEPAPTASPTPSSVEAESTTEAPSTPSLKAIQTTTAKLFTTKPRVKRPREKKRPFLHHPGKTADGSCFERIDGFMMRSTAGGLEHDVSIEECECFCANSRTSKRYAFQCISATYYHDERDCVLNLDNRQLHPEVFVKAPNEYNVTYLGMVCPLKKSIEALVQPDFEFGCLKPLATTTPVLRTTTTAVHTDECFLELPNYILEGDYLSAQVNVSVEECKCMCIDSESRFGSICQSIQYYYDMQTCLLNKENRISDPESFIQDPYADKMSSYFDYKCGSERIVLSMYVEQTCTNVVDVDINSLGLEEVAPPALQPHDADANRDEASVEVKKDSEDTKHDELDLKLEKIIRTTTTTSTAPPTTSTTTTTTTRTTTAAPPTPTTTARLIKLKKTTKSRSNAADAEEVSAEDATEASSTTTEEPSTTTTGYRPVANCRYSALYQTVFNGSRMLKRLVVSSPVECFAACHAERCRSANLIHLEGVMKACELFKDSIIDFRRTDMLTFDAGAVHFDSIQCEDA